MRRGTLRYFLTLTGILLALSANVSAQAPGDGWPTYGGDAGGQRFTNARQITPANVARLQPAWIYHTGATTKEPGVHRSLAFETTPILFHAALYFATPYDEIVAVNPETGANLWTFDPHLAINPKLLLAARGVAAWPLDGAKSKPAQKAADCAARIFIATLDRRLIAVDATNGRPCLDFGDKGSVDLSHDVYFSEGDTYGMTSPPTVIGDVVVVGSMVPDNLRVDIESGLVRGFDVHTGKQLWSWEPLPWAKAQKLRTGAGNAWGVIAADPEHHLLFVPTGAPSPDFYGGTRPGDNKDANSVVALEATTGRRVWGFQVVHHDLWDYDVAAEPLLFTFRGTTPAIAITTKQGLVFVLNRLTGEPLFPVEERRVPASDVPGEQVSPTQPFQQIDSLSPLVLPAGKPYGATPQDDADCKRLLKDLRYEGIYTPPSFRGSLTFPGNLGGVNWGSASFDPDTGILYANTNHYAYSLTAQKRMPKWLKRAHRPDIVTLLITCSLGLVVLLAGMVLRRGFAPGIIASTVCLLVLVVGAIDTIKTRHEYAATQIRTADHFGREYATNAGAAFAVERVPLLATSGHSCVPQPWGEVAALNLNTGKLAWQTPLGTLMPGKHTGTVNLGGDVVTASGLLFTAASEEPYLRAFDSATGREMAKWLLPAPAQATPMSYIFHGRQYVVIAAGGHSLFGTPTADTLVAFALPKP